MSDSNKDPIIQTAPPIIKAKVERGVANKKDFSFAESFCIGRDDSCQIQIQDQSVSRQHAEVYYAEGHWWVRDLQSGNGTYIDGKKIDCFSLKKPIRLELGLDGPILSLDVEGIPEPDVTDLEKKPSVTQYVKQYFGRVTREGAGRQTMLIRQAFKLVQQRQKKKYYQIIAVVSFLLILSGSYATYKHIKLEKQKKFAIDLFYRMKSLELQIAQLKHKLIETQDAQNLDIVKNFENQFTEMRIDYEQSLDNLGVYERNMDEEERLILQIARKFGECEINLPESFVKEVKKYIKKWQSTNKFRVSIQRAKKKKYTDTIHREMLGQNLPPHYFYLALQESSFDLNACGPRTRYGYAKGMWQFIPYTARQYGLRIGRLYEYRRPDPEDERHDFKKSTNAAVRYIRDIYDTEAQASGLLVMASYNWGETRVRRLIRRMPENPRDRNFWRLLEIYADRIPEQTYDYVFRIFSAAVIGENPKLFGFDIDSPLTDVEELSSR